jgi:glycosyltransferase involved in cell wall biosynthesis
VPPGDLRWLGLEGAVIDLVGHFGSRLSYATIANQLVHALTACDSLGNVTNLDDKFVDDALAARARMPLGKKVLLLSDARLYLIETLVEQYGRDNVAVFVCPNTTRLSEERVSVCRAVGRIYTPSVWCRDTIWNCDDMGDAHVEVMPLGVDAPFTSGWIDRRARPPSPLRMLHVTTDTFWPGRKGTEELLKAWAQAAPWMQRRAELTVHCLAQLYPAIHQELGDLGLLDSVKTIYAPARGSTPEELCTLFAEHDLLVAPSRSEGFGVMPLSALVSGTPVLTTAGTGQDYLAELTEEGDPVLGGWMQIPTLGQSELSGEDGEAPTVRVEQLALSMLGGIEAYEQLVYGVRDNWKMQAEWSWSARRTQWARSLLEWEETS